MGYTRDPVFDVGDTIEAMGSFWPYLTQGKKYTVLKYEAETPHPTFTWPAYVRVVDDNGDNLTCHANRFKKV